VAFILARLLGTSTQAEEVHTKAARV
jgi:hypothetical protein